RAAHILQLRNGRAGDRQFPSRKMSDERVIALLGRRDEPTDAVEDYCRYLGGALATHHFNLEIRRVPWNSHGWRASDDALRWEAQAWRNTWGFVQYTRPTW